MCHTCNRVTEHRPYRYTLKAGTTTTWFCLVTDPTTGRAHEQSYLRPSKPVRPSTIAERRAATP